MSVGTEKTPSLPPYPPSQRANYALAVLLLAYICSFVDRQILSLLVGPIKSDLNIDDFQFSLISGAAFAVFYTVMGLPLGRWADYGNRKRMITLGILLWSLMTCLCGFAKSFIGLFSARIGVAVGEAALSPAAYSLLSDYFHPSRLPRAMAIFTLGISLGSGAAFLIGGAVVALVGESSSVALPLIGEVKPWQMVFIVVGLPGVLVAVLMATIAEPMRRTFHGALNAGRGAAVADSGSAVGDSGQEESLPRLRELFRHVFAKRKAYAATLLAGPFLSALGYSTLVWLPASLIRSFDIARPHAGYIAGWLYLLAGTLGTLFGAWFAGWLARRGYRDANARLVALVALALPLPALLWPIAPNLVLAVMLCVPTVFLLNAWLGIAMAAQSLITPNRMRGQLAALLLFVNNIFGLGLGVSLVAALSEYGFGHELALGKALAVMGCAFACLAAVFAWRALPAYRLELVD